MTNNKKIFWTTQILVVLMLLLSAWLLIDNFSGSSPDTSIQNNTPQAPIKVDSSENQLPSGSGYAIPNSAAPTSTSSSGANPQQSYSTQ